MILSNLQLQFESVTVLVLSCLLLTTVVVVILLRLLSPAGLNNIGLSIGLVKRKFSFSSSSFSSLVVIDAFGIGVTNSKDEK